MRIFFLTVVMVLSLAGGLSAQQQQPMAPLKVGIFEKPPFAFKDDDGKWTGLGVSVWERISEGMKQPFDYVEIEEDQAIDELAQGKLDLVVGEMAVSADRARLVNFTQPYAISPAAVALKRNSQMPHVWRFFGDFIRHGLMPVMLAMIGTLFFFSFILWMAERRVHQSHFGGRPLHGFGSALWFSAVTMTTVGYGDKTPQSLIGRMLAFFWMFFGILLVGAFTGTVASSLAISSLNGTVNSVGDLVHFRNGVVEGSVAQSEMRTLGVPAQAFESADVGLKALEDGKITAFVSNEFTLRYVVNHDFPEELVVQTFPAMHVSFAFAARKNFPLFDEVGIRLLDQLDAPDWHRRLQKWTGPVDN